ncbi:hypothetical protein EDB89DRAFT_1913536 [Lactarius sanguifluus]|nr:hypothetical protein EDB89DRAFT_1913536 [Lactarius sanguifluus]
MTTPPSPMKKPTKRARVASTPFMPVPPPARPNSPTLSIKSVENALMLAEDEDSPDNSNAVKNVIRIVGSPDDTYVHQADIMKMAALLPTLTTWGGTVDPLDVVVSQAIITHKDDELAMETLTQRIFEGASLPQRHYFSGVRVALWFRTEAKRKGTLTGTTDLVHRSVSSRSFSWILPLIAAWPPLMAFGPEAQASAVWCFKVDLDVGLESDLISSLTHRLSVHYNGYLFRTLNKAGEPIIGSWYLHLAKRMETSDPILDVKYVTDWLKNRSKGVVVEGSVWYEEICCVCWRSDLHGTTRSHHASQCPAVQTFNKVWKAVNLSPITVSQNLIQSSLQKEPVKVETVAKDSEKMHKELKGEIAGILKQLSVVEKVRSKAQDGNRSALHPP